MTVVVGTKRLGALLVIAIGALGWLASSELERGSAFRMGPGYFPMLLTWIIMGIGIIMLAVSLFTRDEPLPTFVFRPLAMISLGLAGFALTVDRLGILVAVALLIVLSSFASSISRIRETPFLAIGMAIATALLFVKLLGLPIPIFPR